ncbi:MAG: cobalamin-dependent protein [Clostridiales bacterium]
MINFEKLKVAVSEMDDEAAMKIIDEVVETGGDAGKAVVACQDGMDVVGKMFETGEYFVGDLIFAGELMGQAMDKLRPLLTSDTSDALGKMIICTVAGDIHDIGKNIVKAMMGAGGFEVMDLGVDVSPEDIVKTAQENDVKVIGLSGILTLAIDSMKGTVEAFKAAGIRDDVHIIIGGNPVTEEMCTLVGADAWSTNPQEGVEICRKWALAK